MARATDFVLHRDDTLGFRAPVSAFADRSSALLEELRVRGAATDSLLTQRVSLRNLESLFLEWAERRSRFAGAIQDGRVLGQRLFVRAHSLDSLHHVFRSTAAAYGSTLSVGRAAAIDSLQAWIDRRLQLEGALSDRIDSLLVPLIQGERHVSRIQDDLHRTESELRGQLLTRDASPLWVLLTSASAEGPLPGFMRGASENWQEIREFVRSRSSSFLLLASLLVAIVALLVASRKQVLEWADTKGDRSVVSHVLSRPISAAILLAALVAAYSLSGIPFAVRDALGIVVVLPFLRIALGLVSAGYKRPIVLLAGLFLLDKIVGLFGEQVLLWRLSLLFRSAVGCLVILQVGRQVRLGVTRATDRTLLLWLCWLAGALLAIAVAGNVGGFVSLSVILTEGILNSIFLGLVLVVLQPILNGVLLLLVHSPLARRSRYLARVEASVLRGGARIARILLTLTWIWTVLNLFRAARPVLGFLTGILTARFEMGAASISLGGVLGFLAVAWLGVSVSRILAAILEEDILDRMGMPRGVPAAIGRVTQIALIALVFALAAATAGVELSQLALLTGALGVGIGFGMQNVVNNFISGLILMFERPIQLDDIVEVGPVTGSVQKIGFRSSTIRTFEGSSVIVPNANLISSVVINWTHLDQSRRIELAIGVKYGTDPERVIEILVKTAASHPEVSKEPEPVALFQQFGDNSLNFVLRYWTNNFSRWGFIASEVTVAVNKAFAEAGIEIPFPQRTLHVASWSPNALPPAGNAPPAVGRPLAESTPEATDRS